jgi:methyl-accepting chemotaxis protein
MKPVAVDAGLERLGAVLAAVKEGDLRARARLESGPLAPLGQELDEALDKLCETFVKIAASAAGLGDSVEAIERFTQLVAERVGRQGTGLAEVSRRLQGLGARSEEVGQIVELLEDVAAETNILALNAAIEASRAGAQGKGFGMIADEVRKLAERSAVATKDIGAFIQGIEATTDETARSVEEIRTLTESVIASTAETSVAATTMAGAARTMSQTLLAIRAPGPDETDLARALRQRRVELARALDGIAPLLDGTHTPLGEALKQVLDALDEGRGGSDGG